MRLSPLAAVAAACVLTLTACGDDGSDPDSSDNSGSPSASDSKATDKGGKGKDGKDEESESPDLGSGAVCVDLDAEAVGDVVGVEVEQTQVGDNSCTFGVPDDPAGLSVTLAQISVDAAGGAKTVRTTFATMLDGEAEEVTEVGDRAYLVVSEGGNGGTGASGAFMLDDALVQVSVASAELSADDARQQTIDLMKLAVDAL